MDMHHAQARIAVAGATGRVGRHAVEVLQERGHDVVPMWRATGVDIVVRRPAPRAGCDAGGADVRRVAEGRRSRVKSPLG
jgi:nucleoside-diphosphate-sugar epimerase